MVLWTAPLIFTVQLLHGQNQGSRTQTEIHERSLPEIKTKMDDNPLILHLLDERTWLSVKTKRARST